MLRRRLQPRPRRDVTPFSLLAEEFRASPLAAFSVEACDAAGDRIL